VSKDAVNRDFTIHSTLRRLSSAKISVPFQPSGQSSHPVRMPICHCSIHLDDLPYRPDARQTKHHPFGRRAFPSGPSTVLRRFCPTCMRPDVSAARPDASLYSTSSGFFPSYNKGKINQPFGRCGIPSGRAYPQGKNRNSNTPVRTSDSLGPDARSSKKEIADSTSTVWKTTYHGLDARTSVMEIACRKSAVCTLIPHVPDARNLIRKLLAADVRPSRRCTVPSGRGS
jgi:hypothetical protein